MMFKAFPSSQSSISRESVEVYLEAVEDFDIEAIQAACKAFRKGQVAGRNHSFAPSAPELASEVKAQHDRLRWAAHVAAHEFIVEGSDEWRQITAARGGRTPPVREIDGVKGWDIPKAEMNAARMIELPKPYTGTLPAPKVRRANITIGDPDADADMGDERKRA